MGSKERIIRLKEETRCKILDAALQIAKEEGWQALSMRKIADLIEYTAPIIYEYFDNKDAILRALTRKGYMILSKEMDAARKKHRLPAKQMEAIWLAYWNFAFAEKELYQLMFGIQMNCCEIEMQNQVPEAETPYDIVTSVIVQLMNTKDPDEDTVCMKYYTLWSVVHGLVSINIVRKGATDEINQQILRDAIIGITRSISG
ncbi:TetR/AcrR family transcriptional regulator [Chitinophagaceae bacterium MMS25-I14]